MVPFVFAPGMPILWILSLMALILMYALNKLKLSKLSQMPHNYLPKLNADLVSIYFWGPITYSAIGYWMFSNQQTMNNQVNPKPYSNSIQYDNHHIS